MKYIPLIFENLNLFTSNMTIKTQYCSFSNALAAYNLSTKLLQGSKNLTTLQLFYLQLRFNLHLLQMLQENINLFGEVSCLVKGSYKWFIG